MSKLHNTIQLNEKDCEILLNTYKINLSIEHPEY